MELDCKIAHSLTKGYREVVTKNNRRQKKNRNNQQASLQPSVMTPAIEIKKQS